MEEIMVSEVTVPTQLLEEIKVTLELCADASTLISGFLLFFVVVVLCYFVYKLFRMFF